MRDPSWTCVTVMELKGYEYMIKEYDKKIKGYDDMRPR